MKHLKNLGCGVLIGASCFIPGFSGGTMALILGIYEEFMESISLITKHFFEAFKRLWSIAIGMIIGAVIALLTIVVCLDKWPLITSGFFVGLVIATIPLTIKNAKKEKGKLSSWISLFVCAIVSFVICFADKIGIIVDVSKPNVLIIVYIILITSIAAAAMLIPAASGSLILLMFGLFEPAIVSVKESAKGILSGDWSILAGNLYIIIPIVVGIIIGVLAVGKIITFLLKRFENQVWYAILGLLFVSIFAIFYNAFHNPLAPNDTTRYDNIVANLPLNIIGAFIAMVLGFLLLFFLSRYVEKKKKIAETNNIE